MLSTIVTVSLLTLDFAPLVEFPMDPGFDGPFATATVDVVVSATPDRFTARNTSAVPQIFLFGTVDGRHVVHVHVPPGGELDYPFPSGAPQGLALEVLSIHPDAWRSSGPLSLITFQDEGFSALWVDSPESGSSFWLTQPDVSSLTPTSLLPPSIIDYVTPLNRMVAEPPMFAPKHVPVITPGDDSGDAPPVLEDKPLPPV